MKNTMLKLVLVIWILTGITPVVAQEGTRPTITVDNVGQITELAMLGRGGLKNVTWSPDGSLLAVNGSAAIWLYDAADFAAEPRLLTSEAGVVTDMAFSPDGKTLATTGYLMLALWDVATGSRVRVLTGGGHGNSHLAYSPDGRLLANVVDNKLMLWDVTTGSALPLAESSRFFFVNSTADIIFSPDGTLFVWADTNGVVYGWNIAAQKNEFIFREGDAWALAFSPDGKTLAAGSCTQVDEEHYCTQGGLWFWVFIHVVG